MQTSHGVDCGSAWEAEMENGGDLIDGVDKDLSSFFFVVVDTKRGRRKGQGPEIIPCTHRHIGLLRG